MRLADALEPPGNWRAAVALGLYAAAAALMPQPGGALWLALPLVVVPLGWWTVLAPGRWLPVFFCAALLLPPLPIRLGDSGPHPALLAAALGLVAGLVRIRDWRFSGDRLAFWMAAYFSVLLASVAFAALYSGPEIAAGTLARVLLAGIAPYVYFYVTAGPGRLSTDSFGTARLLFLAGAASALFACLDFYFQFPAPSGFGPQFVWLDSGVYRRAQGLFYEASTLGNLCAFFLLGIAVAFVRPPGRRLMPRGVLLVLAAVFATALLASFSRASLLNLAAGALTLWVLRAGGIRRWWRLLVVPASVLAGVAASRVLFPAFVGPYLLRLQASAQYLFAAPEGVLSGRLVNWQAAIRFLTDQPWHAVFGVGYKTLPYSNVTGRPLIVDNMYLSMLVETGVLGLLTLVALSAAILRAGWRAARHPDAAASFFGTWILCFWAGQMVQMLSGDLLTYWRVLPVYFWVLGTAHASSR